MITVVWEYQVKPDRIEEFKEIYAPHGRWAELFKKGKGFLGTRLIQSSADPCLFVTLDQWESLKDYKAFLTLWKEEYEKLDSHCEGLAQHENYLGTFGAGFNAE